MLSGKSATIATFEFLCVVRSKGWLISTFGMPVFPVNNGILRLAKRLRLVRPIARDAETSAVLGQLTRPPRMYPT